ncbi:hypothetical protein AB0J55_34205 [Amycolatopsis sp. NPDC049688]|uniref:hypothetical protein n=1 Tax=Amycolatopsis sp. NPDC049688 TaxID=3154733 RepID=UPI00343399BE
MGSDWSWDLTFPAGALGREGVERLLAVAGTAGLSPERPGGGCNGFGSSPGHEGEHRVLDREQLVPGLATGSWGTNLWLGSDVDVLLFTRHGDWDTVMLSLDACYGRRTPDARAEPFRALHRRLTGLWVALADELGALFGRVEDEWSLEQIWDALRDPRSADVPPPPGAWPEWLSWSTYFDAGRGRALPPLPAELGAHVRRTPAGATVIELADDPAAVDPVRFARLHQVLAGAARG